MVFEGKKLPKNPNLMLKLSVSIENLKIDAISICKRTLKQNLSTILVSRSYYGSSCSNPIFIRLFAAELGGR